MKADRLKVSWCVPAVVGRKHGVHEREADSMAARALGGRSLARREPMSAPQAAGPGGKPLDARSREFFEGRFGHDFSRVRVHVGEPAAQAARELDAQAFTFGRDVFLRDVRDASIASGDPRLLAHELAHVVQAGESRPFAAAVHGGSPVSSSASAPGFVIQRKIVDPRVPHGPGPGEYAETFRAYLLYLHSMKKAQGPQPAFNPYIIPTIEEVLDAITVSPEFRDQVADAYDRMYDKDLVEDIIRFSTEDERDRLFRPFVSGPGDFFPERSKDKAVV